VEAQPPHLRKGFTLDPSKKRAFARFFTLLLEPENEKIYRRLILV